MTNINFPSTGGTSGVTWSVGSCVGEKEVKFTIPLSARTWLSISPDSGVTSGNSTVSAITNSSGSRRDTYIDVILNDSVCTTKQISVSQIACPGDCNSFGIAASASTFTLPSGVTDVGYVVTPFTILEGCDSENISFVTTEGNVELKTGTTNNIKNIQIKTRIPENSSHSVLNSTVKVKYGTYECCTLNFKQNGTIPCDCDVVKYYFDSNKRTFPLSGSGGAYVEIASGTTGGCGRMSALTNSSVSSIITDMETEYPSQDTFVFKAKLSSSTHTVTAAYDIAFIDSDGSVIYSCSDADWIKLTPTPCDCEDYSSSIEVLFSRRNLGEKEIYYYLTTENPKKIRVEYEIGGENYVDFYMEDFDSTNTSTKVVVIPYEGGRFLLKKSSWGTKDCEYVSVHHTTENWAKIVRRMDGFGDYYFEIELDDNSSNTTRECYLYFNYLIDCNDDYIYEVIGTTYDDSEIVTNVLPKGRICKTVRIKIEQLPINYCSCEYANAYVEIGNQLSAVCDIIDASYFNSPSSVVPTTIGSNVINVIEDYDKYEQGYIAIFNNTNYNRSCGELIISGECMTASSEYGGYYYVLPNVTSQVKICPIGTSVGAYVWNGSQSVFETCCPLKPSGNIMILTDWRTCERFYANMNALFDMFNMTIEGNYRTDSTFMHEMYLKDPWLSDKLECVTCTISGTPATYTWMRTENAVNEKYKVDIDINRSASTRIGYYKYQITIDGTTCSTEPIRVESEPVGPPIVNCKCWNMNFNHNFIVADGTVFNSNAGDVTFGTASVNEECYDLIAYSDNTFITPRIENGTIIVNIGANTTGTYVSCRLDIIVFRNGEEAISCDDHFVTIGFGVNP